MKLSKNLQIILICLAAIVIVAVVFFLEQAIRPSDAVVRGIAEEQLKNRLKNGGQIGSVSIIRGAEFPSQAHNSSVSYGTKLYPVVVKVTYTTKQKDGSQSDPKEWNRTLNLYRNSSHHWVNDDELH